MSKSKREPIHETQHVIRDRKHASPRELTIQLSQKDDIEKETKQWTKTKYTIENAMDFKRSTNSIGNEMHDDSENRKNNGDPQVGHVKTCTKHPKKAVKLSPILKKPKSGEERKRRNIIKFGTDAVMQRPITTGSNRDIHVVMKPEFEPMEQKKYNLKTKSFRRMSSTSVSDEHATKSVVFAESLNVVGDDKGRGPSFPANAASNFKEKMIENNDVYNYFNSQRHRQGYLDECSASFIGGKRQLWSPGSSDGSSEWGVSSRLTDTPEPEPLTISDSDECDTDLENEYFKEGKFNYI